MPPLNLSEIRSALVGVLQQLHRADIRPLVYGSVGVSFYLGEYKESYDDIDLLVDDRYLVEDWSNLQLLMEQSGYQLLDQREHEFGNGSTKVAFAKESILERDAIVQEAGDIILTSLDGESCRTLTPLAFVRAYEFSSHDGYRVNQRQKDDQSVIERLTAYLEVTRMHLNQSPFTQIAEGSKTIELRVNDEKRRRLKEGDTLTFLLRPKNLQALTAVVTKLHHAASFTELANQIDVKKTGSRSKDHLVTSMAQYYPPEEQAKYGVVGIEFVRLNF